MKSYATFDAYLADQLEKNQPIIRAIRRSAAAYVYSAPDHVQFGFFRAMRLPRSRTGSSRRGIGGHPAVSQEVAGKRRSEREFRPFCLCDAARMAGSAIHHFSHN